MGTLANPNDPTSTTFLPLSLLNAPGNSADPSLALPLPTLSGRSDADDPTAGWNWGAALLSTFWAIRHRLWGMAVPAAINFLLWLLLFGAGIDTIYHPIHLTTPPDDSGMAVFLFLLGASLLFWFGKTLYLGLRGNALAWRSGLYSSPDQMRSVQRLWAGWGVGVSFLVVALFVVISLMQS